MLKVDHLGKTYGEGDDAVEAIGDLEFEVRENEFVCIVGPSGCGKTTLLKCMSGLLAPTRGEVRLHDERIDGPPERMALVFQEYGRSLYPWMSVRQNVAFPLRRKRLGKEEASRARRASGGVRGPDRLPRPLPLGAVGRHAAARGDRPGARLPAGDPADGRAVRLGRRPDPGRPRGPDPRGAPPVRGDGGVRDARHRRVRLPGRPHRRPDAGADTGAGDARRRPAREARPARDQGEPRVRAPAGARVPVHQARAGACGAGGRPRDRDPRGPCRRAARARARAQPVPARSRGGPRVGIPARPERPAAAREARPGARPAAQPALRDQPHAPARALHPAAPDERDDRAAPEGARHGRRLGLVAVAVRRHPLRDRREPRRPGGAGVLVRPARAVLGREGGAPGGRGDGDPAGRDDLRPAPADDRRGGGHRAHVHADLRAAAARGGARASGSSTRSSRCSG